MKRVIAILLLLCACGARAAEDQLIDPWLRSRLANALTEADQDPQGTLEQLAALKRTWRRNPTQLAFIARETAALLSQAGRLTEAKAELTAVLDGQPPEFAPWLRLALGTVQIMLEELDAARATLEIWRAHVDDPDPNGLFLLGYTYIQADRFGPAIEVLEQAVAATDDPRERWIELLAYAYGRSGRGAEAVALLEGLIATQPAHARWWRQLATVYQLMEEIPRGTATLTVIHQIDALRFSEARYLARLYAYLGMPFEGASLLEATLTQHPDETEYRHLMLLAQLWIQARELDHAIAALENAALVAEDGEALFLLGQLYLHWERYEEAAATLDAAIRQFGEAAPANAYYLLAIAAVNLDRPESARLALAQIEHEAAFARRVASLRRHLNRARLGP